MKAIIGLFEDEQAAALAAHRLQLAGIAGEHVQIISNTKLVAKMLGCDLGCVIQNYTAWGAAIGMTIYGIFGLAAALCECGLMQFGREYGIGALIGALLAGALVGGGIGLLVGAGEAEKDTHYYQQGIRMGGKVISVQVSEDEMQRVSRLLELEQALGIKTTSLERA